MAYRISLHLLATIWHLLLLAWALSLRKTHRYYSALIPVCLFAGSFTAAWGIGLIFESEVAMRLTWVGALWPTAVLFFIREMFDVPSTRAMKITLWSIAIVIVIGGVTPYGLIDIKSFTPEVIAVYGPIEPVLRIGLLFQIAAILWTALRLFLNPKTNRIWFDKVTLTGFSIYGVGALLTCALLPLFGEYRPLESTSYGSVIWTTVAVWHVFKELQERNRSLMELDALKKELINHVTHEFRTPLGAILSAAEIIGDTKPPESEKRKDYVSMIEGNVSRLTHFVNELLDLAAIQQTKVTLDRKETDLLALVDRIVQRLRPLAEKERTDISFMGNATPYFCDEEKIEQVIANLISNAIKAAPRGHINIGIRMDGGQVQITVVDDGIGIEREHLSHIFSSFYRIAIPRSSQKGTGLGLAIAKGWVEAHGGKIWAESDGLGRGAKFNLILPSRN